jgi:HEAT repeat protein
MTRRLPVSGILVLVGAAGAIVLAQPEWQDVVRNLRHPNPETRLDAVDRLGRAGYVAAIEPIAPLVADADDRVQAAAIEAELSFFLTERVTSTRAKSRAQQAFEAGPLVRGSAAAPATLIDVLVTAIRDENARVRFDAVHAVGFIAEPPLPAGQVRALSEELDHYDPVIRMATARVLGRLGQREASDRLLRALDDSNSTVRQFAVESLGLVREDRAVHRLRDLIVRSGGKNIDGFVLALARIGVPDDLALFRQHLASPNAPTRRAAAEGLGRLEDRASIESLEQLAKTDPSASVRLAAAFALQRLGQAQSHTIASMLILEREGEQARGYLFELGRAAVPGLQSVLAVATDSRHRADLVQAVGYLGTTADLPLIEPFLKDRDARVSRAATHAMYRLRRQ